MTSTKRDQIKNALRTLKEADGISYLEIAEFLIHEMGGWEPPEEIPLVWTQLEITPVAIKGELSFLDPKKTDPVTRKLLEITHPEKKGAPPTTATYTDPAFAI